MLIELPRPFDEKIGPGWWAYGGSAYGPGGLRARVGRHLKRDKKVRWHVDRLTNFAGVSRVVAIPGGDEHRIVRALLKEPGASAPVAKFGASDCKACPAHLVRLGEGIDLLQLAFSQGGGVVWRASAAGCLWSPSNH